MIIEPYSDAHYLSVMNLIEHFNEEAVGEFVGVFEPESAENSINSFKNNEHNAFLLIVDGHCEGLLAGMEYKSMTSGSRIFQELIWYVNPLHRGQGVRFFKKVENMLKSRGVSIIIMAVLENSKTEKIKRLYDRLDYKPMEAHYYKRF